MPRDHFSARLENADRLRRKFGRMQAGVREVVSRETKRGLVNIETGAKRRAPVDRGPLRNSITHEMDADQLGGVAGTNSEYGPPVEFGSRPHMPPVQPLIDWARRHGFEDPESAGWAIALHIARFGTKEQPFLMPAFHEERPKYLRRLRNAVARRIREEARQR